MSETPEARSSLPEKERGHLPRPHKHILQPVQNGQTLENVAPAPPDIAESETVKLATPNLNGKARQQDGKPASSASSNGHQVIEETETIKLATSNLNGKTRQP